MKMARGAEAGEVDLDAPVQDYVPEFPEPREGVITPRHLLTHTTGIPHPRSSAFLRLVCDDRGRLWV